MLSFNKKIMCDRLQAISQERRTIFAATCAERLYPLYKLYHEQTGRGSPGLIREALNAVWGHVEGECLGHSPLADYAQRCESALPDEDELWHDTSPYASNAVAAIMYAIETLSGTSQAPMWSALQCYEAVDDFVQWRDGIDSNVNGAEEELLGSRDVQAEFAQQEADLSELETNMVLSEAKLAQRLKNRAMSNPPAYLEQLRRMV